MKIIIMKKVSFLLVFFLALNLFGQDKEMKLAIGSGKNAQDEYVASFSFFKNEERIESWCKKNNYVLVDMVKSARNRFGGKQIGVVSVKFKTPEDVAVQKAKSAAYLKELNSRIVNKQREIEKLLDVKNGYGGRFVKWKSSGRFAEIHPTYSGEKGVYLYKGLLKDGKMYGKGRIYSVSGSVEKNSPYAFYNNYPLKDKSRYSLDKNGLLLLRTQEGVLFRDHLEIIDHYLNRTFWSGDKDNKGFAQGKGKLTINLSFLGEIVIFEGQVKDGKIWRGKCYTDTKEKVGYVIANGQKAEYFDDSASLKESFAKLLNGAFDSSCSGECNTNAIFSIDIVNDIEEGKNLSVEPIKLDNYRYFSKEDIHISKNDDSVTVSTGSLPYCLAGKYKFSYYWDDNSSGSAKLINGVFEIDGKCSMYYISATKNNWNNTYDITVRGE